MSSSFSLPSFAKINLLLRILGKRYDGFHELFTVYQTISLYDTISFEKSDSLKLTCNDPSIMVDRGNLILKAAFRLKERFSYRHGANIHLEKRIASPGGLGGGSSNAVVALIGLSRLWGLEDADLHDIAEELGSDVPFFLYGGTAIGSGHGELIEPLSDLSAENMLVVTPKVSVSTRSAFDGLNAELLTTRRRESNLTVCRKEAYSLDLQHLALKNDFEQSVFANFPEVKRVKDTLLDLGAVNAAMSGSGASVFAIFDKQETRQAAQDALDIERDWRKFAVSTVSRSEYRDALFV